MSRGLKAEVEQGQTFRRGQRPLAIFCAIDNRSLRSVSFAKTLQGHKFRPVTMLQAHLHAFHFKRVLDYGEGQGLEDAFRSASLPAKNLKLPTGDLTYAKSDPKQIVQRFRDYGVRFLTQDEIADELPLYPEPLPSNP